jgi:tetratricopeptide (TPR) repeat protein
MSMFYPLDPLKAAARLALLILALLPVAGCGSPEDRAKSYYDDGMKLMAAHDDARAAVEFKNAVKIKKDYVPAWLALAKIAERDGHWAEMVPPLRTVVELDQKDVTDRLKLARLLLLSGGADEALKLVNDANDIDGHNADVLALRAVILFKLKDANGAIQAAQAVLDIDPKNSSAMSVIAADKMARGDTKGALQILDEATAQKDDLGIDLYKLQILEKTQDLQQAETLLRKLAELYPTEPTFRKELVKLYVFQHRADDALKEQRAIIATLPNDQAAEMDLVRLLNTFTGAPAARQELLTRIAAGGDVFPYQIALAEFDFAQGNFDSSVQLLKSLISSASTPENILTAQTRLAELYLAKKQIEPAEALVSDILRKDNRNIGGLRLRAAIHMERGDLDPAISDLRQALNDQPRSPDLMLLLATAYERSGSIELAEKQFADAMRAANFAPNVGLNYVVFLQRRGSVARAEDVLTDLASRWPQNLQILSSLGQVKLQRQDWVGAQEIADSIRHLGNDSGIADRIRGAALAGQNKFNESISVLQSAYDASPSASQPMAALVSAYVRAKQLDKAVAFLETVLKASPSNAEAYTLLGLIELATKQPEEALKNFNTAIAKDPKDINGYRALANFYLSQQKIDAAQDAIRAGLKEQPDSGVLHLMLASTEELKDNFDGAIGEYETMLSKEPGSLIVANNLASLLADHRTDKASLERARSLAVILQKSPVPQFKDTLGWIDYLNGENADAVRLLEEAAAALPNRPVVHYHLGMAYIATSQLSKAAEQLNTALNQSPDTELKTKIQSALKKTGT